MLWLGIGALLSVIAAMILRAAFFIILRSVSGVDDETLP
jgi:hypothetical protein